MARESAPSYWWTNFRIPTACSSSSSASLPAASRRMSVSWATTTRASTAGAAREVANILEFEKHFPNPRDHPARAKLSQHQCHSWRGQPAHLEQSAPPPKEALESQGGWRTRASDFCAGRSQGGRVRHAGSRRHRAERNLPWEHFAVIYRMNAQSRLLEENLPQEAGFPTASSAGKAFSNGARSRILPPT